MNFVDRPAFAEGQLLQAADLALSVTYARDGLDAHEKNAHVPGIIEGLDIVLQPNVAPLQGKVAFLSPGFAIDRQGREVTVGSQMPIPSDALAGEPSNPYPAYVWYGETALTPIAALDPCGTIVNRIRETVSAGVFASAADALAAHPGAICLGELQWNATEKAFDGTTAQGRDRGGIRASVVVAPEHIVNLLAEDAAPATLRVQGTIDAVAAGDGSAPAVEIVGGPLRLSATDSATAGQKVSLSYEVENATGNGLIVNLGNDDANSAFIVRNGSGTALLTQQGGELIGGDASFDNVGAKASVVVGSGNDKLIVAKVAPDNRTGLQASQKLPLAFGTAPADNATFISGANPVATIDQNAVTHVKNNVALGTFDPANNLSGIAALTDVLTLCSVQRELVLRPANVDLLKLTIDGKILNVAAAACDVTPETYRASDGSSLIRLGRLCVQFGAATLSEHPITGTPPAIVFPRAFAMIPSFFVSAFIVGKVTVDARTTGVNTTGATYKLVRFDPANPSDGDAAAWSDTKANNARVSWLAAGILP